MKERKIDIRVSNKNAIEIKMIIQEICSIRK